MLFHSQFYVLAFLPLALVLYYAAADSAPLRQWLLLGISLVFYGWWDVRFVPLLVGQVTATWALSLWHGRSNSKIPLVAGIVLNLASLATFKYLDFLLAALEALTHISLPRAGIVLPIGISFFSFQLISYLVDRMRNDAPIYPLRPFALFVMFYPHLIAGPIVRHNELIPQFAKNPRAGDCWHNIGIGLVVFTMGFAKKVLLASPLGAVVDPLFAQTATATLPFGQAWTAVLGFTFQLFLDFSAYTEMAIGTALMFGLVLPENFRRPYLACDLRDFWRRWHITLSNFIRDYLYIPLGGSRHGWLRYMVATLAAMGLCGLWHGAGYTFIVWGLWHGCGLIVCRAWQRFARPLPALVGWAITMPFVLVGWVIFRAPSFAAATAILTSMAQPPYSMPSLDYSEVLLFAVSALACVALPSAHEIKDKLLTPRPLLAAAMAALAAACVVTVGEGAPAAFIYFRF